MGHLNPLAGNTHPATPNFRTKSPPDTFDTRPQMPLREPLTPSERAIAATESAAQKPATTPVSRTPKYRPQPPWIRIDKSGCESSNTTRASPVAVPPPAPQTKHLIETARSSRKQIPQRSKRHRSCGSEPKSQEDVSRTDPTRLRRPLLSKQCAFQSRFRLARRVNEHGRNRNLSQNVGTAPRLSGDGEAEHGSLSSPPIVSPQRDFILCSLSHRHRKLKIASPKPELHAC